MYPRADAHIHLFEQGYVDILPRSCRRIEPNELTLYAALARQHGIEAALVVGYEGAPWATGNNQYLAETLLAQSSVYPWAYPLAFVHTPHLLNIQGLEFWRNQGFRGISIYALEPTMFASIANTPAQLWTWLCDNRWLVSVNARIESWPLWLPILTENSEVRLLVSHLGLPATVTRPITTEQAKQHLADLLELAQFPHVYVKLSGFYALGAPAFDYPHPVVWPYIEAIRNAFGADRLLWGSDFSPALEWVSFAQTYGLFEKLSFLDPSEVAKIEGGNLIALLQDTQI